MNTEVVAIQTPGPLAHGFPEDPLHEIQSSLKKRWCFQELPNEILMEIFSFFTVQELCQTVAPVCQNWLELSKDNSLWRTLEFNLKSWKYGDEKKGKALQSIFKRCFKLEKIIIRRLSPGKLSWTSRVVPSFTCITLKTVELYKSVVWCGLLEILALNCPKLETLRFHNCYYSSDDTPLVENISGVKMLRNLTLSDLARRVTEVDDDFVRSLVNNCENLQVLNIKDSPDVTDSSVRYLAERKRDTLREVHLHACNLSDKGISFFSVCTNLLVLDLHYANNITDITIKAITGLHLQTLSISCQYWNEFKLTGNVGSEALIRFFSAPGRRFLRRLCLYRFLSFDESVLRSVSLNCRYLEELEIPYVGSVTDQGLLSYISRLTRLRYLNLFGFCPSSQTTFQRMPNGLIFDSDYGRYKVKDGQLIESKTFLCK